MLYQTLLTSLSLIALNECALTATQKQELLDHENALRSETAQGQRECANGDCPAGTMKRFRWSESLADMAQAWTDEMAKDCSFAHSTSTWRQQYLQNIRPPTEFEYPGSKGTWVGENLAYSGSSGGFPAPNIDGWGEESAIFEYDHGSTTGGAVGHYTQEVAERSEWIGCGSNSTICGGWSRTYTACNYWPGGNYGSGSIRPYSSDAVCDCDKYTDGTYTCDSDGLCAIQTSPTTTTTTTLQPTSPTPGPTNIPTPSPTDITSNPTTSPTNNPIPAPTANPVGQATPPSGGGGDDDGHPSSIIMQNIPYFSGQPGTADYTFANTDPSFPTYCGFYYTTCLYYENSRNYRKAWYLVPRDRVGTPYYYAKCECTDCTVTSCSDWIDFRNWNSVSDMYVINAADAYTFGNNEKGTNAHKYDMLYGTLIGAGGLLVLILIVYGIHYLVKRKKQNDKFNVVQMSATDTMTNQTTVVTQN